MCSELLRFSWENPVFRFSLDLGFLEKSRLRVFTLNLGFLGKSRLRVFPLTSAPELNPSQVAALHWTRVAVGGSLCSRLRTTFVLSARCLIFRIKMY